MSFGIWLFCGHHISTAAPVYSLVLASAYHNQLQLNISTDPQGRGRSVERHTDERIKHPECRTGFTNPNPKP